MFLDAFLLLRLPLPFAGLPGDGWFPPALPIVRVCPQWMAVVVD